jgi:hypothetical protein
MGDTFQNSLFGRKRMLAALRAAATSTTNVRVIEVNRFTGVFSGIQGSTSTSE